MTKPQKPTPAKYSGLIQLAYKQGMIDVLEELILTADNAPHPLYAPFLPLLKHTLKGLEEPETKEEPQVLDYKPVPELYNHKQK